MPMAERARQATAPNMRKDVSGRASRFVSRKCLGKVRKCSHTRGAVKIWQEMLNAIDDHIHFTGPFLRPSEGNQASSFGKRRKIPSIAR